MKPTRKIRKSALHAALLAAGMALAAPALAALPTITVQGVLGNDLLPGTASLVYDASSWLGKAYSLQLTVDAQGKGSLLVDDGIPINTWAPTSVAYVFTVDGSVLFAGTDSLYGELETINNFTVPAGVALPPSVIVGKTYDNYLVSGGGIALGCVDGTCDSAADTYETLTLGFDYFWDVAQVDGISDDSLPNLLGGGPFFNGGFGNVYIEFGQWTEVTGYLDAATLYGSVDAAAVMAVPEADTWALLAAGLGLVGWRVRRRTPKPLTA